MINPNAERVNGEVEVWCKHCKQTKTAQRMSAVFCSLKCRNAYHSDQRRRKARSDLAVSTTIEMIWSMPERGESLEYQTLLKLKTLIENALAEVES